MEVLQGKETLLHPSGAVERWSQTSQQGRKKRPPQAAAEPGALLSSWEKWAWTDRQKSVATDEEFSQGADRTAMSLLHPREPLS